MFGRTREAVKGIALVLACALLASCSTSVVTKSRSTTRAKNLSDSEAAIIETRPATRILSIDGESLPEFRNWSYVTQVVATRVTPGEHVLMLRVVMYNGNTRDAVPLHIRVEAGKRYDVYPVSESQTFHDGDLVSFTIEQQYSGVSKQGLGGPSPR